MEHSSNKVRRRNFLKKGGITTFSLALGLPIIFGKNLPEGITPIGLESISAQGLPNKHPEMTILNDRPINAEAPPHLLDESITSGDRFFVRNNGIPPEKSSINVDKWTLTIAGESAKASKTFTLNELKSQFKQYTYQLTLECGGNGRKEFNPPAKGNQWSLGAVGCAAWTGVRLKDVLKKVGVKGDAVYIGYYGKDTHLSGNLDKNPISRGVPISKAMEDESLIAWSMNGEPLPYLNGYPLRLVFGGWPASCSGKWLEKIVVRNKVHDGAKMAAPSYRVPCKPVPPGSKVDNKDMCIIESMPVKSLITFPKTGATIQVGQSLPLKGHAWAGDLGVSAIEVSIDFGSTWQTCELSKPANRLAWQDFATKVNFPKKGYYEIWARATDDAGIAQPMVLPGWNPKGYLNNACHRIAVKVV